MSAADSSSDLVTTSVYHPTLNRLVSQTKPDGTITNFTLNSKGFATEIRTTGVSLNGANESEKSDIVIANEYDSNGQITQVTDAEGNITQFTYDKGLLIKSVKFATDRGGASVLTPDNARDIIEQYTYDDYGNILTKTDALGNVTNLTYNGFNNLTRSLTSE
jgi:YD repeat-containing protein